MSRSFPQPPFRRSEPAGKPAAAKIGRPTNLLLAFFLAASALPATTYYVTVSGLGGEPDYEQHFAMWAKDIEKAVKTSSRLQSGHTH